MARKNRSPEENEDRGCGRKVGLKQIPIGGKYVYTGAV